MSSISFGPKNSGLQVGNNQGSISYHSTSEKSEKQEHSDRVTRIINYLARFNFSTRYRDAFAARHAGTGQWFIDTPAFQEWLLKEGQTLWCSGMPGAGKTVLVAIVIAYLQEAFLEKSDVAVLFAFCDYNDRTSQQPENMIWSLWKQLMRKRLLTTDECAMFETTFVDKGISPSTDDLVKIFSKEIRRYSRVFLVLDAVDELESNSRDRLIDLFELLPETKNLLITSRFPKPDESFSFNVVQMEIKAHNEDLESYINGKIEASQRLRSLVQRERKLRVHIRNVITEKAAGMFLLAKFHVESVGMKHTIRSLRDSLKDLPEGKHAVYNTYERAMSRICDQNEEDCKLGMEIIMWISHALRPLTLKDLQYFLTLQEGDTELNIDDLVPADLFNSTCAGLVTIEKESLKIRFVHATTQEYVDSINAVRFPDAQIRITRSCIQFLSLEILCAQLDFLSPRGFFDLISNYPALGYAALHWGLHAGLAAINDEAKAVLRNEIELFVHRTDQFLFSISALVTQIAQHQGMEAALLLLKNQCFVQPVNVFAYFGLDWLLEESIEGLMEDPSILFNADNRLFGNILHWATMGDHVSTMHLLLAHKGICDKIDEGGHAGAAPLTFALQYRRDNSAALLLDYGAALDGHEGGERTPLRNAVVHGNIELVKRILSTKNGKASLLVGVHRDQTPIHEAARCSKDALVWFLQVIDDAELGSDLRELSDDVDQNPLHWAAEAGHFDNVQILLSSKYGSQLVTSKDSRGRKPIHVAALFGHVEVTELLINWRTETFSGATSEDVSQALLTAISYNQSAVVIMMLRRYLQAVTTLMEDHTALCHASFNGSIEITNSILEHFSGGALEEAKSEALILAAQGGHAELVKYLIQKGATPHAVNNHGQTALHLASKEGVSSVVRVLLNSTIHLDAEDSEGRNALDTAAENRRLDVAKLLLTSGAQLSKLSQDLDTLNWLKSLVAGQKNPSGHEEENGSSTISVGRQAYTPKTPSDQFEVCFYLKEASSNRLPPSVISRIVDFAEFWLVSHVERTAPAVVTEFEVAVFDYLRSVPIIGNRKHPVRQIDFSITSHDQGFSGDTEAQGTYDGSWTWFDAYRENKQQSKNTATKRHDRNGVTSPEIFRNIHASSQWRTHRVCWTKDRITKHRTLHANGDDLLGVPEETEIIQAQKMPDIARWIEEIQSGDRVTVIPRARFRCWANFVLRAEMTIHTSCLRPASDL